MLHHDTKEVNLWQLELPDYYEPNHFENHGLYWWDLIMKRGGGSCCIQEEDHIQVGVRGDIPLDDVESDEGLFGALPALKWTYCNDDDTFAIDKKSEIASKW